MPSKRKLKQKARERADRTGESYATARRVVAGIPEDGYVFSDRPITNFRDLCEVLGCKEPTAEAMTAWLAENANYEETSVVEEPPGIGPSGKFERVSCVAIVHGSRKGNWAMEQVSAGGRVIYDPKMGRPESEQDKMDIKAMNYYFDVLGKRGKSRTTTTGFVMNFIVDRMVLAEHQGGIRLISSGPGKQSPDSGVVELLVYPFTERTFWECLDDIESKVEFLHIPSDFGIAMERFMKDWEASGKPSPQTRGSRSRCRTPGP